MACACSCRHRSCSFTLRVHACSQSKPALHVVARKKYGVNRRYGGRLFRFTSQNHERFRDWFSHVDDLTAPQRGRSRPHCRRPQGATSLAAIELGVDDERRCPAAAAGRCRGARRAAALSKACGKTFGALTGTALSGLHHKERWLSFGESLAEGDDTRVCCGIAPSTAHRWRQGGPASAGPACRDRRPTRPSAREPEGGADASRASRWILVAADRPARPSATPCLPLNADRVRDAGAGIARDALLETAAIRPSQALDIPHESINRSAAVCAAPCTSRRNSQGVPGGFRSQTKYLDSYAGICPCHPR